MTLESGTKSLAALSGHANTAHMITPALLLVWLLCAIGSGMVAQAKRRSFGEYFVVGLLLGFIGLIIALCARPGRTSAPTYVQVIAPPGWQVDPYDSRYLRYWDGTTWTPHAQPATYGAMPPTHVRPGADALARPRPIVGAKHLI
jgi:Protein of unknown function (DUF2510)